MPEQIARPYPFPSRWACFGGPQCVVLAQAHREARSLNHALPTGLWPENGALSVGLHRAMREPGI